MLRAFVLCAVVSLVACTSTPERQTVPASSAAPTPSPSMVPAAPSIDTWRTLPSGTERDLQHVGIGGDGFVLMGDGGALLRSIDGRSVVPVVSGVESQLGGYAYRAHVHLAFMGETLLTSSDGAEWHVVPGSPLLVAVVARATGFLGIGRGTIETSADGRTWSHVAYDIHADSLATDGNTFVATGVTPGAEPADRVVEALWSIDGTTWEHAAIDTSMSPVATVFGMRYFWILGRGRELASSSDGRIWSFSTIPGSGATNAIAVLASGIVVVGDGGSIITSPDGVAWTPRESGTSQRLTSVACGVDACMAVGAHGAIVTSAAL